MSDTIAKGVISSLALKFDKHGRPYLDLRLTLDWVDNLDALTRQSSRILAVTFSTKEEAQQIPLFEAP